MKKLILLLCIGLAFVSCNKGSDPTEPASTANFSITGTHDIDLTKSSNATITIPISIVPNAGSTADTVVLSMSDLPKGLYFVFRPSIGKTPFDATLTFFSDFSGAGGNIPVILTGTGHSGVKTYKFNVLVSGYKGWKIDGGLYSQTGIQRNTDTSHENANLKVFGGGNGVLIISFSKGRVFPTKTTTYNITSGSTPNTDNIQIGFSDGPLIYNATGTGSPTGTFSIDTLGKLVFKCSNVEMSNGVDKKILDCSINE